MTIGQEVTRFQNRGEGVTQAEMKAIHQYSAHLPRDRSYKGGYYSAITSGIGVPCAVTGQVELGADRFPIENGVPCLYHGHEMARNLAQGLSKCNYPTGTERVSAWTQVELINKEGVDYISAYSTDNVCHAQVLRHNEHTPKDRMIALSTCTNVNKGMLCLPKALEDRWLKFCANDSVFSGAFISKKPAQHMLMNPDAPSYQLLAGIQMTRYPREYSYRVQMWDDLVHHGVDPHVAMFWCHYVSLEKVGRGSRWYEIKSVRGGGGHSMLPMRDDWRRNNYVKYAVRDLPADRPLTGVFYRSAGIRSWGRLHDALCPFTKVYDPMPALGNIGKARVVVTDDGWSKTRRRIVVGKKEKLMRALARRIEEVHWDLLAEGDAK